MQIRMLRYLPRFSISAITSTNALSSKIADDPREVQLRPFQGYNVAVSTCHGRLHSHSTEYSLCRVQAFDGLHKTHASFRNQIEEREPSIRVVMNDLNDKP